MRPDVRRWFARVSSASQFSSCLDSEFWRRREYAHTGVAALGQRRVVWPPDSRRSCVRNVLWVSTRLSRMRRNVWRLEGTLRILWWHRG
jgi:hypothetical protein